VTTVVKIISLMTAVVNNNPLCPLWSFHERFADGLVKVKQELLHVVLGYAPTGGLG